MNNNDQARLSQNQYIGLKKELFPKKKKGSSYLAYDTEELYIYNHLDRPVLVAGANIEGDLASPRVFLPASELSIDYMNVINESQVSEWNSSLAEPKKDTIIFYTGNDDSSSVIKQVFHVDINGDVTPIYERKENSNYNRILSGHVEWSGSGLNFESTNITYIFNNEELICQSEAFELNISNSGDRIDVVAVNNEGELVIIEGIPSENPQEPTINFETELRVTAIYLNEGESTPSGMYDDIIYDENLGSPNEWDEISSIPQNNIDLNSSDSPYSGVKHISAQNLISGNEFNFRKNSLVNLEGLSSFSFRINSLGEKNKPIYIKLLNNGNGFHAFEIQPGTYGLSVISSQDYELITVPYSVFNPSNEPFNEVSIAFSQNSGDSISEIYLDKIRLVYGMENPALSNTFLNLTDTPNSYNSFGEYDVVVKKDESGLEFIKRKTKLSEFENDEGFITSEDIPDVPEYTLSAINGSNQFQLLKDNVVVDTIDLTSYLDDTNLARIVSGVVDPNTGIATITRDDSSTFTIDFSSLIDAQPTSTQELINEGADGTSTYVEHDELGVVATSNSYNDLDDKPTIPAQQTNLSDFNDDIGATDGILPLSALIDPTNGNDTTAELENFNKPFKTLEALFSALPATTGETYTIYMRGTTIPVLRRLVSRNIKWVSYTSTALDFSNIKEDDGITQATQIFTSNGTHTWTFENENVSLICSNTTAIKLNGVTLKGRMGTLSWDTPQYSYTGNLDINTSNIYIKQLNFIGSGRLFHGSNGDIEVGTLRLYSDRQFSYQGAPNITIHNIIADNLSVAINCNITYTETGGKTPTVIVGNVNINGILFTYGSVNHFNNSVFSDTSQLRVSNTVTGNITSNNYLGSGSNANNLVLSSFTGKLVGLSLSNGTPIIFNSSIETNGSLFTGAQGSTNNITVNGLTSIIQKDLSANLFLTYSYNNLNYPNDMHLIINGSLKSNVKDYGYKVTYETPTATFKERLGEIVIRSKRDIINKVLDNSLTYIIDGTITLTAGEYIEVPAGGNLTINGYGLEASNIIKNVAGESILKSPIGGSGGLQMDAIKFTMGTPTTSCFDLTDATGFNAVECVKVNFEGSGNIGTLNGYRQYLWTNIGIFGLGDGLTFEGTSIGGFSSNSIIVRNLSGTTGTLFKKGTSFSMASRFSSNANIDIPSGWAILDFEDANFVNSNSLQLQGMFVTRAGVSDENDALYFPNINEESDKCDWKANEGIKNSAISFEKIKSPDGAIWKLEVDNAGVITATAI